MKTLEIKKALELGTEWKRISKVKLDTLQLRLFQAGPDGQDGSIIAVEYTDGTVKEASYDMYLKFVNKMNVDLKVKGITLQTTQAYLVANRIDFILASLAELRLFNSEITLKGCVNELEDIVSGKDLEIEAGTDYFTIEKEDSEHLEASCFRVDFDSEYLELVTD